MEEEIWKHVVGYEGYYAVSNMGRVKSLNRLIIVKNYTRTINERILVQSIFGTGYHAVFLSKNSIIKTITVHRLVATAFISNPENLATINHKDSNKSNNREGNLEWMSILDNVRHAIKNGFGSKGNIGKFNEKNPNSKKIYQYNMDGVFLKEFPSVQEAARNTGGNRGNIGLVAHGKVGRTQSNGYRWSYEKTDTI